MKTCPLLSPIRLILLLSALAALAAHAQTYTWDGGGTPVSGEYLWSDENNWFDNAVPPTGSTIHIQGTEGTNISVGSAISMASLWFRPLTDVPAISSSFTLSGADITVSTTNGIQNQSGSLQTINNNLIFTASGVNVIRGFRYNNIAPLNGPGNITLNGNVTVTNGSLHLRADNGSIITANGTIGGADGASIDITAGGDSSGSIYLNGANHISTLTVSAGKTYLGNVAAVDTGVILNLSSDGSFFYLNGYNLEISSLTNSGSNNGRQRIYNASATAATLTYNRSTTDETFTGQMADTTTNNNDNFSLVKKGSNTLTLAPLAGGAAAGTQGGSLYKGGTSVQAGTLLINNPNVTASATTSATGTGAVSVLAGATFGGNGYTRGDATVDGTLRAGLGGDATGTLRLGGALTLESDSVIELALGAAGAHSVLARVGSGAWSFQADQTFTLLDFGMEAGTYDGVITGLASLVDTSGWTISNEGWTGLFTYDNGSINLTLSVIPEPSTALFLFAAFGFLVLGRFHNRLGRRD